MRVWIAADIVSSLPFVDVARHDTFSMGFAFKPTVKGISYSDMRWVLLEPSMSLES